jgi:hypothetical protein
VAIRGNDSLIEVWLFKPSHFACHSRAQRRVFCLPKSKREMGFREFLNNERLSVETPIS